MLVIDLPENYENSIVQTQVMVQMKETKRFEQEATTIRESINVDISVADMNVTILYATADANATRISNEAKRQTIQNTILYE